MAEIFMISPLMIKSKSTTRLERLKQGDDNTTGCLLTYRYFKDHYQLIAVDVSKQKEWMLVQEQFSKLNFMEY